MECAQVRELLEPLALHELSDVDGVQVRQHLSECTGCASEYRALTDIIRSLRELHVTDQLAISSRGRITEEIRAEIREQRHDRRWLAPSVLAVAATIVVAVAVTWFARGLLGGRRDAGLHSVPTADGRQMVWQLTGTRAESTTVAAAPAVSAGKVYALRSLPQGDVVAAVRLSDGQPLWTSAEQVRGHLAADQERVYAVSAELASQGQLVALDAATGKRVWAFSPSSPARPTTPQAVAGGVLWVAGDALYAVDARRGTRVWRYESATSGSVSEPCVVLDRAFVAAGGQVVCLDVAQGRPLWTAPLSPQPSSFYPPTVSFGDNRLYVADRGADMRGTIACFEPVTGAALWQRQGLVAFHAAACGEMLYVRGARITALDAASGVTVWERDAAGCSPLFCVFGRLVYADASRPQALTVVEAATGRAVAEVALANSCSGFTMAGSVGLVNTNDGVLHAVSAEGVLKREASL